MKIFSFVIAAAVLFAPARLLAAPPYENAPDSKSGPGVEEIWTDNGVRYYRGLPGTPNSSRPRITGVQRYQPEIEFGEPGPLTAPGFKKAPARAARKAVKKASARKAAPVKKTASVKRKRPRRTKAVATPVAAKAVKPLPPATRPLDDVPVDPGSDPFSGLGILGTTRLQ